MPFSSNLRTCGVYFVYLLIFFWMLIKEFLGYQVDWSRRPFTQTRQSRKVDSHKGFRERNKDLEANLDASANTVFPDGSKKMTSNEKQDGRCDSDYFVIYEAHPVHTKEVTCTSRTGCGLTSQVLSPEPGPAAHDRTRDSSCAHSKTPAIVQSREKDVSHIDPKLEGFIAEAVKDSPHEQRQLEDAATSRLNFVQGLKYKENNNFRFPAILSALRVKSTKLRREPKKGMSPKTGTIPTTRLSPKLKASSISTVTSAISKQTTLVLDSSSCHFPSLSLPPVQTSTSSVSSYSSTYTIVETSLPDLPTPTDEDIPISFNRSLPSWRRDPDRAKFVFGSLARSVISDEKSQGGVINNGEGHLHSIAKPKAEGERNGNMTASLHEAAISEKCSTLKDQRLESIIIAMGLNPLPSASTLHSNIGIFEDKDKELGKMQLSKDHEMTHTGSTALMDAVKSRESVVSDLLSWVESSSSSSSQ